MRFVQGQGIGKIHITKFTIYNADKIIFGVFLLLGLDFISEETPHIFILIINDPESATYKMNGTIVQGCTTTDIINLNERSVFNYFKQMAKKRMLSNKITTSDAFLDMPKSTQCLYFHLNMQADDEGYVGNPKMIMRMISCSEDDLKILIVKRFLLSFESGVVVIKHRLIHNTIRKDRMQETTYLEEKKSIILKENGVYTEVSKSLATKGQPDVSIDKTSIDENRLDEISSEEIIPQKKGDIQKTEEIVRYDFVERFMSVQEEKHQVKTQIKKHGKSKYFDKQHLMVKTLIERDGYTADQVELALGFVLYDDFRRDNIMTVTKLRDKNRDKVPYIAVMLDKAEKAMFEQTNKTLVV